MNRAGVAAAKRLEFDRAVDWIIVTIASEDDGLACEAAQVMEHFFEQEEAAIRRKYLAVTPLIEALARPGVAACAARALGAAEKKRAVPAVLQLIAESEASRTREEAVRSLGLLRDTDALRVLQLISTDASEPPAVAARAMIARRRLAESQESILRDLDDQPRLRRLEVMTALYSDEDTAVLSRRMLDARLEREIQVLSDKPGSVLQVAAIRLLGSARKPGHREQLLVLKDQGSRQVVEASYLALAHSGAESSVLTDLAEQDLDMVERLLSAAPSVKLSPLTVLRLLQRGLPVERLAAQIQSLSAAGMTALFEQAASSGYKVPEELLRACARGPAPLGPEGFLHLESAALVTDAAIDCFLYGPGSRPRQQNSISTRITVKRALARLDADQATLLRQKLAARDVFYAQTTLFQPLTRQAAPYFLDYIVNGGQGEAAKTLATMARDERLDTMIRVQALDRLALIEASGARKILLEIVR